MVSDPQAVLTQLEIIRLKTLQYLNGLKQEQLDWQPPSGENEDQWSLGEVFMHLASCSCLRPFRY